MDSGRARVLAYRAAAHDLEAPGTGAVVLAAGIQDYPSGRSTGLALRLRTGHAPATATVLAHSVRGALHLHDADDLGLLMAALRIEDGGDFSKASMGPFGEELAADGLPFGTALDQTAAELRAAVADGNRPTKGELSGEVSPRVDPRIAPWCNGCGSTHVQDQLFRQATLQAGLVIELDPSSPSQFRYRPVDAEPGDPDGSRAELVRRFLAAFGPATPTHLAGWLALKPAAVRHWWELVADELTPIRVEGRKLWLHTDDLDLFEHATEPTAARLLPPYDPITELADRPLLVGESDLRKLVWRAVANPGIVMLGGEIAGIWRQRRTRTTLALTVEPFAPLAARHRRALAKDADAIGAFTGADRVDLTFN